MIIDSRYIDLIGTNTRICNIEEKKEKRNYKRGILHHSGKRITSYIIDTDLDKVGNTFDGRIVGIIILKTGEVRVVVSNKDSEIYYDKIKGYFRNDKFAKKSKFKCLHEKSAGCIIYKIENNTPEFLIVYSKKDIPGFPKGHIESGETEEKAAIRETREEVGVDAKIIPGFKASASYNVENTPIQKELVLFLSEISEEDKVKIQESEINNYEFLDYESAKKLLFRDLWDALDKAKKYIDKTIEKKENV